VISRGSAPYRAVLTHGFIVDQERNKISKSSSYEKPQTSDAYIGEYGADVVRLWIASQDFRDDIPISKEILSHVGETYRLLRNTFRYQLSNLFDFDPAQHSVPPEQLDTLDRWALGLTADLIRSCTAAYEACEFHKVYQLCNQFCSVTLSATYHDVLKDRLYTLATNHPLRRSSQTVMHHIFTALTTMLSPILTFTTDEAWSYGTARSEYANGSVHLSDWPDAPANWSDATVQTEVTELLRVRALVNEAIEPLRAAGNLGKSIDAAVSISGDSAQPGFRILEKHHDFLPELFIVSHVSLKGSNGPANSSASSALAFTVQPCSELGSAHCPRCRRWVPVLEATAVGPVCSRCREALQG
jgi:isoleucyl-tRNA synthetase